MGYCPMSRIVSSISTEVLVPTVERTITLYLDTAREENLT